jgi:hypothetical protein
MDCAYGENINILVSSNADFVETLVTFYDFNLKDFYVFHLGIDIMHKDMEFLTFFKGFFSLRLILDLGFLLPGVLRFRFRIRD